MDLTGPVLAIAVAVVSGGLLFWHVQQVKKRPATGHDRLMGALWAALLVLALGRLIFLVAVGDGSGGGAGQPAPATPPAELPK